MFFQPGTAIATPENLAQGWTSRYDVLPVQVGWRSDDVWDYSFNGGIEVSRYLKGFWARVEFSMVFLWVYRFQKWS